MSVHVYVDKSLSMTPLRPLGIGIAVGAAGATSLFLLRSRHLSLQRSNNLHTALRYGSPTPANLRFYENFVVSFDTRTRNPTWVMEYITQETCRGLADRKNTEFREDKTFPEKFRSHLSDFKASGYDRGHLAPAANHKLSQKALEDTFLLTNISPQVGKGFNRDYWARFERFVKEVAYRAKEVFVITGPLFLPRRTPTGFEMCHPMIGQAPSLVSVPTHFYKVILSLTEREGEAPAMALAAFVMPNAPLEPSLPLTAFAVPLEALEAVAGLHFFPKLMSEEKMAFHDRAALVWQARGNALLMKQAQRLPYTQNPFAGSSAMKQHLLESPKTGDAELAAQELPLGVLDRSEEEVLRRAALPKAANEKQMASSNLHKDAASSEVLQRRAQSTADDGETAQEHKEGVTHGAAVSVLNFLQSPPTASGAPAHRGSTPAFEEPAYEDAVRVGLLHLCNRFSCQLPPPDWYLKRRMPAKSS